MVNRSMNQDTGTPPMLTNGYQKWPFLCTNLFYTEEESRASQETGAPIKGIIPYRHACGFVYHFADEAIQRLEDIPSIKGAYSGINIKLMKCTGMREAWKMANYARAEGMRVMVGCMTETSCAVSAAAQLSPVVDFADLDGNLLISNDRFDGMTVVNGKITLPDRPGIGIKLL